MGEKIYQHETFSACCLLHADYVKISLNSKSKVSKAIPVTGHEGP
jgi:hypothetical protein